MPAQPNGRQSQRQLRETLPRANLPPAMKIPRHFALLSLAVGLTAASAQTYTFSTLAGQGANRKGANRKGSRRYMLHAVMFQMRCNV